MRILSLLCFVVVALFFGIQSVAAATPSAILNLSSVSTGTIGDVITVQLTLDSPSDAVSAIKARIVYSGGLQYTASTFTSSVFDTEVAAPTADGTALTFARTRTDTGYIGTGGQVATLSFTVTASGSQTVNIDDTQTQVIAYSDSTNVYKQFTGADIVIANTSSGTTVGTLTQTGINILVIIAISGGVTAGLFFLARKKRA